MVCGLGAGLQITATLRRRYRVYSKKQTFWKHHRRNDAICGSCKIEKHCEYMLQSA
ncbi:hypothetical protein Mapa_018567 [Marchantia paleacea]|nr:hypothetical protein Mapa_018567 [Marchantia paleacea]